jgi:P-type Ca2+ transporter type 2C
VSFVALVVANFGLVVVNRSFSASIIVALLRPNLAFWRMVAATAALLAAALFIPPMRRVFHFDPIHANTIGLAFGIGVAVMIALEWLKRIGFEAVFSRPASGTK